VPAGPKRNRLGRPGQAHPFLLQSRAFFHKNGNRDAEKSRWRFRSQALYSMLCNKQLLRPRFSVQLDAQTLMTLRSGLDVY